MPFAAPQSYDDIKLNSFCFHYRDNKKMPFASLQYCDVIRHQQHYVHMIAIIRKNNLHYRNVVIVA